MKTGQDGMGLNEELPGKIWRDGLAELMGDRPVTKGMMASLQVSIGQVLMKRRHHDRKVVRKVLWYIDPFLAKGYEVAEAEELEDVATILVDVFSQ
jgi:hypothetical protein